MAHFVAYNLSKNCTVVNNVTNCSAVLTFSNITQANTFKSPGFVALTQVLGMFFSLILASTIYWCCVQCRSRSTHRYLFEKLPAKQIFSSLNDTVSLGLKKVIGKETEKIHNILEESSIFLQPEKSKQLGWGEDEGKSINYKSLLGKKAIGLRLGGDTHNEIFCRESCESIRDFMHRLKSHSVALEHLGGLCDEYTALCDKAMYSDDELNEEDYNRAQKCISIINEVLERSASRH